MLAPGASLPGHLMNMGMPSEAAMIETLLASGGLGNMGSGGMGSLPGDNPSAYANGHNWQFVSSLNRHGVTAGSFMQGVAHV